MNNWYEKVKGFNACGDIEKSLTRAEGIKSEVILSTYRAHAASANNWYKFNNFQLQIFSRKDLQTAMPLQCTLPPCQQIKQLFLNGLLSEVAGFTTLTITKNVRSALPSSTKTSKPSFDCPGQNANSVTSTTQANSRPWQNMPSCTEWRN
jgi:hypothetical protein